ncbi:MAG: asparagine synthase (glutamine-hydrolyzing) [Deltaproteobacteria bacterium]|nr:asparagine synthase (glutamine-hydrolyzing) [Deltaproteobacteria bacterium]
MCGIAGIINFYEPEPKEALLRRMLGLIRHRGPDAAGIYQDRIAGLGSVRLSILDLPGGNQPIHNEDQSIWIVYNGQVFNYPELRQDLEARGHQFYTKTDTEVLIHLYEEYGTGLFNKLNGQFAFALWDRNKETLLLGRDRLGIRPFFYYRVNGRLVFGSEIKAIFADPSVPRAVDYQNLSDIFTCWTPVGHGTTFRDIQQLNPGCYATFTREGLKCERYWALSFSDSGGLDRPLEEWIGELKDLLYDASKIRLRADVPVGAYLSGGLDSTYISSLIKRSFNNKLCTFSVSFTDGRFDEAPFQEKAVQSLGTEHRSIRCTEKNIGEVFPDVIWHAEVPILRTGPAPLFLLSKLVNENAFKVVLTGEGSDEIFAGYDIFKEDRMRRFWAKYPDSKWRPILFKKLYPDIFRSENSRSFAFLESFFKKGLSRVDLPGYSHMIRWENTRFSRTFFSDDLQRQVAKDGFEEQFASILPSDFMKWDPLSRAQYTEISLFLSDYLLSSQGDRVAMAHAVEGRYPFLDYRVVEFAAKVPAYYRLHVLRDKFILREAAKEIILPELANRPKQPYRAPTSRCFLGEKGDGYVQELLSERVLRESGYFHPGKVSKLVEKCQRQDGHLLSERESMALVGIISTQLLDHLFIKNFPPSPIQEPQNVKIFEG